MGGGGPKPIRWETPVSHPHALAAKLLSSASRRAPVPLSPYPAPRLLCHTLPPCLSICLVTLSPVSRLLFRTRTGGCPRFATGRKALTGDGKDAVRWAIYPSHLQAEDSRPTSGSSCNGATSTRISKSVGGGCRKLYTTHQRSTGELSDQAEHRNHGVPCSAWS